jgi:DNA-binding IclR family transcriptional regulator
MSDALNNRDRVLNAIKEGAGTPAEIMEDSGLTGPALRTTLTSLIDEGVVERRERPLKEPVKKYLYTLKVSS